ncbi:mucin-2-like [Haliotis cracherodii]|uniref:mucin-2-like n=1 Tax=Haliotis cracherodii TaxID=6455 RepID=UPI0039EBC262
MFSLEDVMKMAKMAGVAGPLKDVLKKTLSTETPVAMTTTVTPVLVTEVTRPSLVSTRRRTRMRITSTEPYQSRRPRNGHDPRRTPNLPSTRQTPTWVPKIMSKASDRLRRRRPRRQMVTGSTEEPLTTKIYSRETSTHYPITEITLSETILPTPENIVTEMTTMDKARIAEKRLDNTFNSIQQFLTKNLNSLLSSSRLSHSEADEQVKPWSLSESTGQVPVTEPTTVATTISRSTSTPLPETSTTRITMVEKDAARASVKAFPPATIVSVEPTSNLVIDQTTITKIQQANGSPNLDDIFGSMRQDLTMADFLNLLTTNYNIPIEEARKLIPVATSEKSISKFTTQKVATFINTDKPSTSTATVTTTTPTTISQTSTTTFITTSTAVTTSMKPITAPPVTVTTNTTSTMGLPTSTHVFERAVKKTNDINIKTGSLTRAPKNTPSPFLPRMSLLSKYSHKKISSKNRPFKNPPSRDKLLRMLRESNKKRVKLLSTYRKMGYHRVEHHRKNTTPVPSVGRIDEAINPMTTTPSNSDMTSQVISKPNVGLTQASTRIPFTKTSAALDINTLKTKSADSLSVNDLLLLLQMKINKVTPTTTKVATQGISTTTVAPILDLQQKKFLTNSTSKFQKEPIEIQEIATTMNETPTTETPVVKTRIHKIKSKVNVFNRDVFAKLKHMARARTKKGKNKVPTTVTPRTTTTTATSPTTTVPPTTQLPRILSVLIRPQKRRMPKRVKQRKFLLTTTQTPTTQIVPIQDTPKHKSKNKLNMSNFMSSLQENIHGLNSSKNLDVFERKLEHILATSRRLRGGSPGTVHGGINVKINMRKNVKNSPRMQIGNNKSKKTLDPRLQVAVTTITTTKTPRQRPTTTYSPLSLDTGNNMQPTYQDIITMGQTNITALIKSIIRTSKEQKSNYANHERPIPDTIVPAHVEPVQMLELSTPKTIHLSDIQISFKTKIPKEERLGGVFPSEAAANGLQDTKQSAVHVHGGIDIQTYEVGESDVMSEPEAEPEPEAEAEPEPEPEILSAGENIPNNGHAVAEFLVHHRIQDQGGRDIYQKPDVMAEPEIRPSLSSSDIIDHNSNRMLTAHKYTQTEIPPVQNSGHIIQDVHIPEGVSEPTVYGEPSHGHTRTISLRNMQRNNMLQTRVIPANSSPGRRAKGGYRVSHDSIGQGASARGPRVSSPRSMTSIFSSQPGIPTTENRRRDPSVEEGAATDDSTNSNSKSNGTSFETKRSHLSSSQLYPGGHYSRHPSQEPSSPYIDIGRPSGIEHNFQTVGRTRASIRRREGRISNVPSHNHGNEPFPDVYGGMLRQHDPHAGIATGSESHRAYSMGQANRHTPPADQLTIGQSNVRPVQNRAGFKANEMHPPDTHSRRQPVLQSANPRASKLQQYQQETLASSNSNPRNRQSSNRRYTNNDFQKAQVQTVYDPESETYITKPIVTNSQSGRHQHADNHYQRNQQQQHLLQQQQQHQQQQQQQQQQQYMRQQQMAMQEAYNQEQKQNMNVGGHHASPVNEGRQNIDPYYQNQQHLAPSQHYPQEAPYQGMTQGRTPGDVMMLMQII